MISFVEMQLTMPNTFRNPPTATKNYAATASASHTTQATTDQPYIPSGIALNSESVLVLDLSLKYN